MKNKQFIPICLKCKQEVAIDEQCQCGGKVQIIGDFNMIDKNVRCSCGSIDFRDGKHHIDFANKSLHDHICVKCSNTLVILTFRELV